MVEFRSFEEFEREAERIVYAADESGIILRLVGGVGIRYHCTAFSHLYEKLGRTPKHDMDFASYSKYRPRMKEFFLEQGYKSYPSLMLLGEAGKRRQIYNDQSGEKAIDIFFDKFVMNHPIDFKDRLELDKPTIPITDLFLQKTQIVELNEKDIQDLIILLRGHEVGNIETETVNAEYVAKLLSDDWGFYYTVATNLRTLKNDVRTYKEKGLLEVEDQSFVNSRIDLLIQRVEEEPKSVKWKLRAKIGTSRKWYNVVEEVQRDTL